MTTSFVPITSTHIDPTGVLIAIGAARIPDVAGSAEAFEPVFEMAANRFAGECQVELVGGQVEVRARISEPLAVRKVETGVFRGFSLALLVGADNATRICRIAFVDSPDVAKAGSAQFLKISRRPFTMTKTSILCDARQVALSVREAKDRKAEAARIGKAAAAANPPPGGFPAIRSGESEHQSTGDARRHRAAYGQDQGGDACQAAIRAALARLYAEAGGLISMLNGRHA